MSIKKLIQWGHSNQIKEAYQFVKELKDPSQGWLFTMREALGMSRAQLARRRSVSRNQISKLERGELKGSVTLGTMMKMADAMNCRFVYAIIPDKDIDEMIEDQAKKKAYSIVKQAGSHMALENQALPKARLQYEIKRVAEELIAKQPADFWDD